MGGVSATIFYEQNESKALIRNIFFCPLCSLYIFLVDLYIHLWIIGIRVERKWWQVMGSLRMHAMHGVQPARLPPLGRVGLKIFHTLLHLTVRLICEKVKCTLKQRHRFYPQGSHVWRRPMNVGCHLSFLEEQSSFPVVGQMPALIICSV